MAITAAVIDRAREEEREDLFDEIEEAFELVMTANWLDAEDRGRVGRELLELAAEGAYEALKPDPVDGTYYGGARRKLSKLAEDIKKKNPKKLRRRAARLMRRGLEGMAKELITQAGEIEASRGNG